MKPERRRVARFAGWAAALFVVAATGGCRFLADEFTWLDRQPPGAGSPPDAPVSGIDERP